MPPTFHCKRQEIFQQRPPVWAALILAAALAIFAGLMLPAPAHAQEPDLRLTKTDSADPVPAGALLTYTLAITNTGPVSATSVIVTDTLPAEVEYIAAESSVGNCAAPAGGVLTCTLTGDGSLDILLVSSETGVTGYYTNALTTLGYSYTLFDASGGNPGPTAAAMSGYELVIWAGGEGGSPASPTDETELAAYLDGGGRLFISAQDYHFNQGLTPFMQSYLGVGSVSDDNGVTDPVSGVNGFAGLGPYATNFPGSDYSDDITPSSSGNVALVDDASHRLGVNTAHTVFFAFPWEAIANDSATNGEDLLHAIIDHLTAGLTLAFPPDQPTTITVTVQVKPAASGVITNSAGVAAAQTDPQPANNRADEPTTIQAAVDLSLVKSGPATIIGGEVLTYTLTYSNAGSLTAPNVVITDIIPAPTLTVISVSSSGAALTPTGSADFVWQAANLPPGAGGVITLTAQADEFLSPGATVVNTAEIAGSAAEGNLQNNRSAVSSAAPTCLARVFNGVSDGPIRATAQAAVDEAAAGQLVKVAGYCAGVNNRAGLPQAVIITKPLTLQGGYTLTNWTAPDAVAHPTTLDAVGLGRVVNISGTVAVTIDGMRLINGNAASLGGGEFDTDAGGGIYSPDAELVVRQTQILSNVIDGSNEARGGGVYNNSGSLMLIDSLLAYNRLDTNGSAYGGGLYNAAGTVTLTHTTIFDNSARGNAEGPAGYGGGLYHNGGNLTLSGSTLAQNYANRSGGGLALDCGSGCDSTIVNSTLSGNSAASTGGGIYYDYFSQATTQIIHATIVNNSANSGAGIFGAGDGGTDISYTSTILAGNSAGNGGDCDNTATLSSNGYNLLAASCPDDGSSDLAYGGSLADILLPLALNPPGSTQTHALIPGSPASDQIPGGDNGCGSQITTDQRGAARPQGSGCDIGAYESGYALALSKRAEPLLPWVGQRITYTLILTNSGDLTATNLTVSDTVPGGLTYAPGSIAGGSGRDDSAAPLLSWTAASLTPGTPITFTFAATVSAALADSEVLTNTAAVTSAEVTTPVTASATVTVVSRVDVRLSKTVMPAGPVQPGSSLTYTLSFSNAGPGLARGVVITDVVPGDVTALSSQTAVGSGVAITRTPGVTYAWTVSALAAGQGGVITLTGQVSQTHPGGLFTNTALITTTGVETDTANNRAEVSLAVISATLSLTPSYATNPLNTPHTVTASLRLNGAAAGAGHPITFAVSSGPHAAETASAVTNANGQASFTYTGTVSGLDVITAAGVISGFTVAGEPVEKEWVDLQLSLVPGLAFNPISSVHTVTATLLENGGRPQSQFAYVFSITGTHPLTAIPVFPNSQGQGVFSYTGTLTGVDSISVRVDYHGLTAITTVQKVWFAPGIALVPATATQVVSNPHTVTATVTSNNAALGAGIPLTFTVTSGPHVGQNGSAATNANGQASFIYTGTLTGTDTIRVQGVISGQLVTATAVITWTAGARPPVEPVYLPIIIKSPPTFEVPQ